MNLKASFFNFNYLKENMKKSKGVMFLFIFIIPIFTYLFMLLQNNASNACFSGSGCNNVLFPTLSDLSIPSIILMYIAPFVIAVTLFNYLFKKDSVDFINALPIKRSTMFITNIIGGIIYFLLIFLLTSLIMFLGSFFFDRLVIPSGMYFHYFITFFIAYVYVFLVSSFTIALTGSRMVHVALTLIFLFIPGFVSDFYNSRLYDGNRADDYYYATCETYDTNCIPYEINNNLTIGKSFRMINGQTLPYKYINVVPRALFNMSSLEVNYQNEVSSVYNLHSILKMFILSIIYFALGLYAYSKRKMEIAETTFKNENVHQLVKCLTLFPLCLGTLSIFNMTKEPISLWIMGTITVTIYVVYDLITHRNSGKFTKSVIYFLSLVLATIIIYFGVNIISGWESKKDIKQDDVANIGLSLTNYLNYYENSNTDLSIIKNKITDKEVMDLIFDNANKKIPYIDGKSRQIGLRLGLKNGVDYYFNIRLTEEVYNRLLSLMDKNSSYTESLKDIPYNKIYGVQLGGVYQEEEISKQIIKLIKEGYKNIKASDIINTTYVNPFESVHYRNSLLISLYVYDDGIKVYQVNSMINPGLINYVVQMKNRQYINEIKNKKVNINYLVISMEIDYNDENASSHYEFLSNNQGLVYRYINDNIRSDIDFSKYEEDDIVYINVYFKYENANSYQVYIPKDANYEKLLEQVKAYNQKSEW